MGNIICGTKNTFNVRDGMPPVTRESGGLLKQASKKVSFATVCKIREVSRLDKSMWYSRGELDRMKNYRED